MNQNFTSHFLLITTTAVTILFLLLNGCSPAVTIADDDYQDGTHISQIWSLTDSRLVAQQFANDLMNREWLKDFVESQGRSPAVYITSIEDRTSENINTTRFVEDLVASLGEQHTLRVSSGRLEVSYDDEAEALPMDVVSRINADFIIQGKIEVEFGSSEGNPHKAYLVVIRLFAVEKNEFTYIAAREVRKLTDTDEEYPM